MTASGPGADNVRPGPRVILLAALVLALFLGLRIDNSTRTYFGVDDQVVVWLVDDAVNHGRWQPDWYRAEQYARRSAYFASEGARTDLPHAHHYNFSAHILLSAAVIKPLRQVGLQTPTITLLHHIAVLWDSLSLALLVAAAWRWRGLSLALCTALLYSVFPLAVQGSHYARPDALLTAMGSAVLYLSLHRDSLARRSWWLATGTALGLAVGAKASQLMLGLLPAIACCAVWCEASARTLRSLGQVMMDGVALLLVMTSVLALFSIAGDMHPRDLLLSVQSIQQYYLHPGPPDILEPFSFGAQFTNILHYFSSSLGPLFLLAVLGGCIDLLRQREITRLLVLAVPLLLFLLYFSTIPAFFDRSFSALAGAFVLLAALGICSVQRSLPWCLLASLLASSTPIQIQYHLQTDHLRSHHNDDRLAFQKRLRAEQQQATGIDFWIRNIDRSELFGHTLPERPPKNPRIYVQEDLNDAHSRRYRQLLLDNGFVQIAEFTGDFADMPTNSLITVHEAARFYYFVRRDEWPGQRP